MHSEEQLVQPPDLTESELSLVNKTLRQILESVQFCKSKRYPAFLEFIVLNTLAGNHEALKERTLGAEVFERPPDWDTGNDSIVRNAAVEVRKRMALFYSEHPHTPVRIDLPAGSYVAEFVFYPMECTGAGEEPAAAWQIAGMAGQHRQSSLLSRLWRMRGLRWAGLILLGIAAVAAGMMWRSVRSLKDDLAFWQPVLGSSQPAILIAGGAFTTNIPDRQPLFLPEKQQEAFTQNSTNWLLNDPVWVAKICGAFTEFHKNDCKIIPSHSIQIADLLGKSVVVIGAINNGITDQLLAALRYQFRTTPWVEGLPHQERSIVDQSQPDLVSKWRVSHDPPAQSHNDFAIVARFHSAMTNGQVIVIAGLRPEGTTGAGEFITAHGSYQKILALAPRGWKGTDFEAVLQVEADANGHSNTKILTAQFW